MLLAIVPWVCWDYGSVKAKQFHAASPHLEVRLSGSNNIRMVTFLGNIGWFTFLYEPASDRLIAVPPSNILNGTATTV